MTVKTKLKLDDWFKSYGPMKYPLGSPLGAAILCILPSRSQSSQITQRAQSHTGSRSHTGLVDYDEACSMHLTPGVVHNFPEAVSV